ncbi:glucan biosynthesis protein G [Roseomonas sp. OT10]|uniref:glucan biosynthesis protein n=1 Tax=Roseomonas cutis TaxID=2897332 RepID=UPI001E560DD7|nr:glucan biosynthesis protein G [Roseomonas sp. OT10]UFN50578.1 glucan biosynthesis protein G [Roseomonas sp. OT10]
MQRRDVLATLAIPALLATRGAAAQDGQPFAPQDVRAIARELAQKPFQAPDTRLPGPLANLSYDRYRMIRFDPQKALWKGDNLPFQMQLFHRGFLYAARVDLYEVADGRSRPIPYSPDLFDFGPVERPAPDANLGFAGFRLHAPLNRPDYFDEVAAFLGASYFRAVGRHLGYGLSARGLAIKTADPGGEEFPFFRAFWIERPRPGVNAIVVHALLDSPSAAASYRFTIRPGDDTVFDVEATVFPRADLAAAGIAPLTSMFWFAPNDRAGVDDFRPAVHDSDGLLLASGRGEQLWRPLHNPRDLQVTVLADANPRGFGLVQRRRDFDSYQDLEARYERRPSLWIEPIGDWGEGAVQLVEIPTGGEIHDNIVAFWRPKDPLRAKGEYGYVYRMHWLPLPQGNPALATFVSTRAGAAGSNGLIFVLDAVGGRLKDLPAEARPKLDVSAGPGRIQNPVAQRNPETGGWRISFELLPGNAPLAELRAVLSDEQGPLTESWIYRWTR